MKKIAISTAIILTGCIGFVFCKNNNDETKTLTDLQLANIEALAEIEGWIEIEYDKNCLSNPNSVCARSASEVHYNSEPYPPENN